jgi:hypothetical protein
MLFVESVYHNVNSVSEITTSVKLHQRIHAFMVYPPNFELRS